MNIRGMIINHTIPQKDLEDAIKMRQANGQLNISVLLPYEGEYVLRLYSKAGSKQKLDNVCNYLLTSVGASTTTQLPYSNHM